MSTEDQAPLPEGAWIIRLATPPKDYNQTGRVLAVQLENSFQLSSEDKKSVPPHLSVWAENLTSPSQAYAFLTANRSESPRRLVIRLNVDEVRSLQSRTDAGNIVSNLLNIIWIHLFKNSNDKKTRDSREGASGHAGIIGLDKSSAPEELSNRQKKNLRKDLRAQLAELASQNNFLLNP